MANQWYAKGAEKLMSKLVDLSTDTIKAVLVKNTYVQNLATHEFLSDAAAYIVGTPYTLSGKSITGGVFDANDPTFTAVAAGDTVEAVLLVQWKTSNADSPLLMYIDNITAFPFATNGGDVTPQWDNGAYKITAIA